MKTENDGQDLKNDDWKDDDDDDDGGETQYKSSFFGLGVVKSGGFFLQGE